MKEETYLKAKVIMDEVEHLRALKKLEYPLECYRILFSISTEVEVSAGAGDIGQGGVLKMINTFNQIIDDLIAEKLQKLEELG